MKMRAITAILIEPSSVLVKVAGQAVRMIHEVSKAAIDQSDMTRQTG